jgi:glycosyltransferase involved in cell wall biosynthesis
MYRVAALAGSQLHLDLEREGYSVVAIARGRADPRIAFDLLRIARSFTANVVDAHNMQSQYWAALASLGWHFPSRVATVHSVYREEHPGLGRRELREGALWLCRLRGFRFLAVSTRVQAYLANTIRARRDRIILSWNGIERPSKAPPPLDLRAETGWRENAFVLGVVGRLEKVKGHNVLLDALHLLADDGEHHLRLLIVGSGRDEASLKARVNDLALGDCVHFTGFRRDISAILAGLDLLCVPSHSEGLPFIVLEAAQQGLPVLASELDGLSDLFDDDQTIFFSPPGDPAALAGRLRDLIADPQRRMRVGLAAKTLVETDLSTTAMIEETLRAYQAALPT